MISAYTHKITPTEQRRAFIKVPKSESTMFPELGMPFTIKVGDDSFDAYTDRQNRILVGGHLRNIEWFKAGTMVTITKINPFEYMLERRART